MEFKRWKFSKEAKPELEEFLKCVKNREPPEKNIDDLEKEKILKMFLPQLPLSYYELENYSSKKSIEEEIISIDSEDIPIHETIAKYEHEPSNIGDISIFNLTLAGPAENSNCGSIQDFVEYLTECNDCLLQKEDVKRLETELNSDSLKELFGILVESFSNKGLLNLGKSLCSNSVSASDVARQYCRIILLGKLIKSDTSQLFKNLVKDFIKTYPEITREEILLPLLNVDYKCGNVYQMVLSSLQEEEKEKLIRDFVFSCSELESFQLLTLQPLMSSVTEHAIKHRIINLMSVSADKFNTDKTFIKILIDLIKNLGKGFTDQEPVLYEMVDKNKTILKTTAQQALNEWFNEHNQD